MRLLRTDKGDELVLEEYFGRSIPPYAILSHTWEQDEVTFTDVQSSNYAHKKGFKKLSLGIQQARTDSLSYFWADTCCIDKSSSAELSEAINSMYKWYQNADICYVYLTSVHTSQDDNNLEAHLIHSRWWSRGWTLQELLAPNFIEFYSADWQFLGTNYTLINAIVNITTIDESFLVGEAGLHTASIAKRMSWAAKRETTREEDIAYCLLGIFDVNMPLLYGEGEKKAFLRLQEEVMRKSDDHSLFAWQDPGMDSGETHGLLADSPRDFTYSGAARPYINWSERHPYTMTNRGLSIYLRCPALHGSGKYIGLTLKQVHGTGNEYVRTGCNSLASIDWTEGLETKVLYVRQTPISTTASMADYPERIFVLGGFWVGELFVGKLSDESLICSPRQSKQTKSGHVFQVEESHNPTIALALKTQSIRGLGIKLPTTIVSLGLMSSGIVGYDVCSLGKPLWPIGEKWGPREQQATFLPVPFDTTMQFDDVQLTVAGGSGVEDGRVAHRIDLHITKVPGHGSKAMSSYPTVDVADCAVTKWVDSRFADFKTQKESNADFPPIQHARKPGVFRNAARFLSHNSTEESTAKQRSGTDMSGETLV